jgi:hypothetical protein
MSDPFTDQARALAVLAAEKEILLAEIERLHGHIAHRDKEIARLDALIVLERARNAELLAAFCLGTLEETVRRLERFGASHNELDLAIAKARAAVAEAGG